MENLIETFHIDLKLIIAQMFNFAVVFLVLYWFAFKPIAKVMSERTNKIEKSLDDAKKIETKLAQAQTEFNQTITEAKQQANALLTKAGQESDAKKAEMIVRAKEEIGQIINKEKQKMQAEKAQTLKEIKQETADLVILTVEKILGEKVDAKKDKEIIKKIIKS